MIKCGILYIPKIKIIIKDFIIVKYRVFTIYKK